MAKKEWSYDDLAQAITTVRCPKCRRGPGLSCCRPNGDQITDSCHMVRIDEMRQVRDASTADA